MNQGTVSTDLKKTVQELSFVKRPPWPHDPSDAGSNPAGVVEFLRTEKFREQVLREGLKAV
jgi:hypothetical protein